MEYENCLHCNSGTIMMDDDRQSTPTIRSKVVFIDFTGFTASSEYNSVSYYCIISYYCIFTRIYVVSIKVRKGHISRLYVLGLSLPFCFYTEKNLLKSLSSSTLLFMDLDHVKKSEGMHINEGCNFSFWLKLLLWHFVPG